MISDTLHDAGQSTPADEHDARQLKIRELKELRRKLSQLEIDREDVSQQHEAEFAPIRQRHDAELQTIRDKISEIGHHPAFDHFGVCPACFKNDGYVNIESTHWFICEEHRVKWFVGANLFSCWKMETEEIWHKNYERIKDFAEISETNPGYHPEDFDRLACLSADAALAEAIAEGTKEREQFDRQVAAAEAMLNRRRNLLYRIITDCGPFTCGQLNGLQVGLEHELNTPVVATEVVDGWMRPVGFEPIKAEQGDVAAFTVKDRLLGIVRLEKANASVIDE